MSLDNVIGFGTTRQRLETDILNLRTNVILYGGEHSGKFTFAKALAESVTSVSENIHIVSLQDKKTQITIEQIRQMLDEIKLQPYNGDKRRIVIIDEAQTLNNVSENAILKLLEEPPPHVLVMLIVNDILKLLPTIRSRCYAIQMFHTQSEVDKVYAESSVPKDILDFVREVYRDQIGIVIRMNQDPDYQETIKSQMTIVKSLPDAKRQDIAKFQEQFQKVDLKSTLMMAMSYYMEHKPQNPELLQIIHNSLNDANRNLNEKLIVDSLIGGIASSNKKCYRNNNTNS